MGKYGQILGGKYSKILSGEEFLPTPARTFPSLTGAPASATSTQQFQPPPPRQASPSDVFRAFAAEGVDLGANVAPFALGPGVGIPTKMALGFAGGAGGNLLNQAISPPRNVLDTTRTLETGQTQVRETGGDIDYVSPLVSGGLNALTVGTFAGAPEAIANRIKGNVPKFSAAQKVPKDVKFFERGVQRSNVRGGIAGQRADIELVRADLSDAFRGGLNPDKSLPLSQRVTEPIRRAQAELFLKEEAAANAHPEQAVPLKPSEAKTIFEFGKEIGVESKYAPVKRILDEGGSLTPRESMLLLRDLNADVRSIFSTAEAMEVPPSPSLKAKESALNSIRRDVLRRYSGVMESYGVSGIREIRLRQGALSELVTDIKKSKNKIDKLSPGVLEDVAQKRHHSFTGTTMDKIFGLLRKSPGEYVARAAKEWGKGGLTPADLTITSRANAPSVVRPQLPPTSTQIPKYVPGDVSGLTPTQPFVHLGVPAQRKLLPPATRQMGVGDVYEFNVKTGRYEISTKSKGDARRNQRRGPELRNPF